MPSLTMSSSLKTAADQVMRATDKNGWSFSIELVITSTTTDYNYTPTRVTSLVIYQKFFENYTDEIYVGFKILAKDYLELFKNNDGLQAQVNFKQLTENGDIVADSVPDQRVYVAILLNPQDLATKYNIQDMSGTRSNPVELDNVLSNFMDVELQLLEEDYYKLRHLKLSTAFRDIGVDNAIRYISRTAGSSFIRLVDPHNQKTYENLIIPAFKDISNIFDFIQANYGVYNKGLEYYFTENTMHIYPPFETEELNEAELVDIYSVPVGMYGGALAYHTTSGEHSISIVSNSEASIADISKKGAEEAGNVVALVPSENVIDNHSNTIDAGAAVNDDYIQSVSSTTSKTAQAGAVNMTYAGVTDNVYYEASKIAAQEGSVMTCQWTCAKPFSIYPGQSVRYHYDAGDKYTTRKGLVDGMYYKFDIVGRYSDRDVFRCVASILIRLSNQTET